MNAQITECINCIPGQFKSTFGNTNCVNCPAGFYTLRNASTQCAECPSNAICTGARISCAEGFLLDTVLEKCETIASSFTAQHAVATAGGIVGLVCVIVVAVGFVAYRQVRRNREPPVVASCISTSYPQSTTLDSRPSKHRNESTMDP